MTNKEASIRVGYELGFSFTRLAGKLPTTKEWQTAPRASLEDVLEWGKHGNIGLRTGQASGGLVAIDFDAGANPAFEAALPKTAGVVTGGGGRHRYFRTSRAIKNSAGRLDVDENGNFVMRPAPKKNETGTHIDVRGDGGQVVYAGSIHPQTGAVYEWMDGKPPTADAISALPASLEAVLTAGEGRARKTTVAPPTNRPPPTDRYARAALAKEVDAVANAAEGCRNDTLNRAAYNLGQLVGAHRLDEADVVDELVRASALPVEEAKKTIASGLAAGKQNPRPPEEPRPGAESTAERQSRTLAAIADALAKKTEAANSNTDAKVESSTGQGLIKWLADSIQSQFHFARDEGGKLYVFEDGVYKASGEKVIRKAVKRVLEHYSLAPRWTSYKAEEVVKYIAVDLPDLWPQPPLDVLNVGNGLLDIKTRVLRPHEPTFFSPVQLPVNFDPAATCPAWDKFVAETFPEETQAVAWQILAWLMLPYVAIQKAVLLLGEGANGKSTYLTGATAFIGKNNIAAVSLQKLEADKFAAARLVGKLANICPDLPSEHLSGTSVFKSLVGGDVMLGERKYADSFEFSAFARLVFSANHPPRSADASHAFFRRWVVVPFNRTFDPAQQIPRNVLDARLSNPKELSGVLNKALEALPGLYANGFIESLAMRDAWHEFRETTDPLAVWLDRHVIEGPDLLIPKADLLLAYNGNARRNQTPTATPNAFGRAFKRLRPKIDEAQRTVAGNFVRCWLGIGLKDRPADSPA